MKGHFGAFFKKHLSEENKIDTLCMQETEVNGNINAKELLMTGPLMTSSYSLELAHNSVKSQVGFYISKKLNNVRRNDLEGIDSNVITVWYGEGPGFKYRP